MKKHIQPGFLCSAVLLLFLIATTGCQKIVLYSKGVRNPTVQTNESVCRYLSKNRVGVYDGSFIIRDSLAFIELIKHVESFPSVSFFTPGGNLIIINDSGFCAGVAHKYASSLNAGSSFRTDTSFHLTELNPLISSLGPPTELEPGNTDIILIGFWATYFGSVNKNVFGVFEAIRNNPGINCRLYLINTDFMQSWGMKGRLGTKIL